MIFICSLVVGNDGLKDIKLSPMEYQAFWWATKDKLESKSLHTNTAVQLVMDGWSALPEPHQWEQMSFISGDGKRYAIKGVGMAEKSAQL
ncbi:uncharacterized protein N7473_011195 [Penicillium subrubescens]|nr:uncharacterized protein N7473_013121 [Penicillium subrubescens]XP_057004256.1 uncharacterized protein N7473_011195 [Penicillium subrubescens]KAJ5875008.1 hypothetical protein N7473_013121 [Penicillium subrubescens]KAJ5882761.1 hypothetical protein N7473_011195 [Penicillium subrubescens]